MSNENKTYKRIRAEDAGELAGWHLPQVSGPAVVGLKRKNEPEVRVVEEVIAAEKITVAELEAIREAARLEGLAAGLGEGRQQGLEEGKKQGYSEGRDAGYQEGLAQGEQEILRLQAMLNAMLVELEMPVTTATTQLEQQLLNMTTALAKAVVGAELSVRHELLLDSIRAVLEQIPEPLNQVRVRVCAADKTYLDKMLLSPGVQFDIALDENLTAGSYVLETSQTRVDYDVEARFAEIAAQFSANVSPPSPAPSHE